MPSGSRSGLNMLTEAAHFLENQQQNLNSNRDPEPLPLTSSPANLQTEASSVQNGNSEHNGDRPNLTVVSSEGKELSQYGGNKRDSLKSDPGRDEINTTKPRASMGMYGASEINSADEGSAVMPQYSLNNGVISRLCPENKHLYCGERPSESPPKSPDRKQSSPARSEAESGPQARSMVLPQPLLPGALGQPITHIPTPNALMPFVHPSLMYQPFDPTYADALARQAMGISNDASRLHSPSSSPSTSSSSAAIPPAAQGLQGLMYPLANPALLMGPRNNATQGIGLSDMPMLFPQQLAVYGAANLLPQQIATWASLAEPDKRMFEGLPGLGAQSVHAHLLPYFKNFGQTGLESSLNKDTARSLPKPAPVGGVGLVGGQGGQYPDFWFKYNEALHNEGISSSQSSPVTRRSLSPDNSKKSSIPTHAFSLPYPYANNVSSLTKSPVPERKTSSPSNHSLKNGTNNHPHHEARPPLTTRERDSAYGDSTEPHINGEEARRLMAFTHRQRNVQVDSYVAQNKVGQDHQSPPPRTDRYDRRRTSREYSPYHQPSLASEKSAKKRHEPYGIPRDLIPDRKISSPGLPSSVTGLRLSKSPQRRRSGSPTDRLPQSAASGNPFAALTGKVNVGSTEKDDPAYFAQVPPYMFHPALGSLAVPPFGLPGTFPSSSKAMTDAIAASSLASAAGAQLLRPTAPSEAIAEYARLASMSPYAYTLLMPQQQQQQFRSPVAASVATTSQEYAAARKQAALYSGSLLEARDKERLASPSNPAMRSYLSSPASAGSKMARGSPIPNHHKPPSKRPLAPTYNVPSRTPPVHLDGVDSRIIKQELSPSAGKRGLVPTSVSHPRSSASLLRRPEDDRRLKRRAIDDEHDRPSSKDLTTKRKREVNGDVNAAIVDEHFRRSLGDKYKEQEPQNKVLITGLVNDHFQKALGNMWNEFTSSTKSSTPDTNGRDIAHRVSSAQVASHFPHQYPAYLQQPHLPGESRSPHPYTAQAVRNLPGGKTVKARGIVYPDMMPDVSAAAGAALNRSCVTTNTRMETSDSHGHVNDSQYPPSYDSVNKHTNGSLMDSVSSARSLQSSPRPDIATKKFPHPQHNSPRPVTPPSGQDKPLSLSLSNSSLHSHSSMTSHLPPYNASPPVTSSFTKSPSGPPPAYSPHSSASSSSLPPPSSPRRGSADSRPGTDAGVTVPVSVQT